MQHGPVGHAAGVHPLAVQERLDVHFGGPHGGEIRGDVHTGRHDVRTDRPERSRLSCGAAQHLHRDAATQVRCGVDRQAAREFDAATLIGS